MSGPVPKQGHVVWSAPSTDNLPRRIAAIGLLAALMLVCTEPAGARSWSSAPELGARAGFPRGDAVPPSTPSALTLTGATATALSLSWQAARDNRKVSGYVLYRDDVYVRATSRTSATFEGLRCGRTYRLGVAAYDPSGNRSAVAGLSASTSACADVLAPTPPTNVVPTGATTTSVSLFWASAFDDVGVAGYGLYRSGVRIASTTGTSFVVGDLACGTSYLVGVDSFDAAQNRSTVTSVVASTSPCPVFVTIPTVTPPAPTPPAPTATRPSPAPTQPAPLPQSAPQPSAPPASPSPAPAIAKPLGFSNGLAPLTHPQRARLLDEAVSAGVRWVRLDVDWWAVEGVEGQPNWQPYKDYLALAKQKGVQVLGLLDNAPPWHCGEAWCAPDPTRFGQFCGGAARELGPLGLRYVEVWNEPNIVPFFKPRPDAVRYTEMLRQCYDQVKAVDRGIFVVSGGLSPAGGYNDPLCNGGSDPNESADVNPLNFLERMYANGAKDHFDALGWHPYDAAGPTSTHRCGGWNQMSGTTPSARSIMIANGDSSKPIWATEWGVDLAWVGNDETLQATHTRLGLELWNGYPWAGHIFYFWQWAGLGGFDGFSASRADWTKRPIWNELAGYGS